MMKCWIDDVMEQCICVFVFRATTDLAMMMWVRGFALALIVAERCYVFVCLLYSCNSDQMCVLGILHYGAHYG